MHTLRRVGSVTVFSTALIVSGAAAAQAASNPSPSGTGQPSQSCGSDTAPDTPGQSSSAPGSAFNPDGNAGMHYAGEQPQNSNNTHSVSQYDVACYHTS
ncbi:MAG TPA: hypothetical protein VH274_06895 [Mycobacteriales bacterium]|nr:hypothetical protein [Mycobacteriales bacterium]